ncbi:hypothetical protein BAUCODRAFT_219049 [Baudoinia panamericana UAMH 10762]|uniref:BTB domain-containing protein n=1 Tax=Baudoinia panamericana (strain UAMH 10762) TaxID=717646 RepID=M2LIN5_BAUPA|nr:uncharacterized protein BAUCODRAFT_219049 [Baudoinia panamericana UAMH 10762]EMC94027.1 hypothetical protein BAUCODRAFT_219049 [Baudoinia panamericana UAMH 10762]
MSRLEPFMGPYGLVELEEGAAFPHFNDGDVLVVISGARQYKLHSSLLRGSSIFFRIHLRDEWAAKLCTWATDRGVTTRYRFELRDSEDDPVSDSEIPYKLQMTGLDEMGRPINALVGFGLDLENGVAIDPHYEAFDIVLAAIYSMPIRFSSQLPDILPIAIKVVDVAEYLNCIEVVKSHIEAAILATTQTLYQSIANKPVEWLKFAVRMKSRVIYREGLIHGVGQFYIPGVVFNNAHNGDGGFVAHLDATTAEQLTYKAERAKYHVITTLKKLLSYYQDHLFKVNDGDGESISKGRYSSDIFGWMALTLFRQWLTTNISAITEASKPIPDMGFELCSRLAYGNRGYAGYGYLDTAAINEFNKDFPMSNKGIAAFRDQLDIIKDDVAGIVSHLMINESNVNLSLVRPEIKYFLFESPHELDYHFA